MSLLPPLHNLNVNVGQQNNPATVRFVATDDTIQLAVDTLLNLDQTGATGDSTYGMIENFDTSRVTIFEDLFKNKLRFNADLRRWDTSKAVYMSGMFEGARDFEGNGLDTWNVHRVVNMNSMFKNTRAFVGDTIEEWDVSNVSTMSSMFEKSLRFNANLQGWETFNVTDMYCMFRKAKEFAGAGIEQWKVQNVTDMMQMFYKSAFSTDISKWDVRRVSKNFKMFAGTPLVANGNVDAFSPFQVSGHRVVMLSDAANQLSDDFSNYDLTQDLVASDDEGADSDGTVDDDATVDGDEDMDED